MKRLTDPDFVYRPAASTDISATFKRVRARMKAEAVTQAAADLEQRSKVKTLRERKV